MIKDLSIATIVRGEANYFARNREFSERIDDDRHCYHR